MKNKTLKLLTFMITAICCSFLLIHNIASAEETSAKLRDIEITKQPSRTSYTNGQKLNLSDMEVTGYYQDGSSKIITEYTLTGFIGNQIGNQTITVEYDGATATLTVRVTPSKVTNVTATEGSSTSITLTWDELPGVKGYEIYSRNEVTKEFGLAAFTEMNTVTLEYEPGTILAFYINAVADIDGVTYTGELSDKLMAATGPEAVGGLTVAKTAATSIDLSWTLVPNATGYIIYRAPASSNQFARVGTTAGTTYTDKSVVSGTAYRYKVSAYIMEPVFSGDSSDTVDTRTKLSKLNLTVKAGEEKVRLSWKKVNGATSYDIYVGIDNGEFVLLTTQRSSSLEYIYEGLTTGSSYSFYGIARRTFQAGIEDSPSSDIKMVDIIEIPDTSTEAKLFTKREDFETSDAFTEIEFYQKNVDFDRSFIIPGLINTNISGFSSSSMCPQGLTFAGDYLMMSAYDMADEENSVVYVMDQTTGTLLVTLVLPTDAHVGGISYDGSYLWITVGTRVCAVDMEDIKEAVESDEPYVEVDFASEVRLGITASFITYYDNLLWVGSYNELKSTKMYSYRLDYETDEVPTLKRVGTLTMPTRVQGVAFTEEGYLIISRSCQLYKGLRGYMRQLDIYKPDRSSEYGTYRMGNLLRTVDMPSMNEEIAINGSYLYVNFESAAFYNASYPVDRISAFDLNSILFE